MLFRPQCVETLSFLPVTDKCCGVTFPALNIEVSNLILTFSYLWLVGVILFGILVTFPMEFYKNVDLYDFVFTYKKSHLLIFEAQYKL